MKTKKKIQKNIDSNYKNIKYSEIEDLLLALGFSKKPTQLSSTHVVFTHPKNPLSLTIQNIQPYIKPRLVKQALQLIDFFVLTNDPDFEKLKSLGIEKKETLEIRDLLQNIQQ